MSGEPTVSGSPYAIVKEIHFSFVWKIENLSCRSKKVGTYFFPPKLSAVRHLPRRWYLCCYPNGISKKWEGHLSLFLHTTFPVSAKVVLSILNVYGEEKNICTLSLNSYSPALGWGTRNYISRRGLESQKDYLLPNDTLSICCKIIEYLDPNLPPASADSIPQDLGELLSNPQFSDIITLLVGGERLQAHKAILSSRSPTFSRMLNSEMKESSSGEILIEDISKEALQEMLRYLYTGQAENIDKLAMELYYVADKYQVDGLKQICNSFLQETLSISNCIETLTISDRHCDEKLKDCTLDYITNNVEEVIETEAWKKLLVSNWSLAYDVFCFLVKKYVNVKEKLMSTCQ